MAEGSNVQHIAELGFDITQAKADLQAISDLVEQYSIKISDLAKVDYNPFAALEKSGADLSKVFDVKVFENINKEIKAASASTNELSGAMSKSASESKKVEESSNKLSKTERELLSVYRQSAQVQAQIRRDSLDNTGHAQTAATLREQVNELFRIYQTNGQLNEQEKERLETLNKQMQVLRSEVSVERSDLSGASDGIFASAGKWFSVYQALHMVKKAGIEVYETMRDVETRMMEIGRVMDTTAAQSKQLQDALFGVAQEMAQTFEGASEISLRFAQAGYHDMAENIELTRVALLAMNTAELDAVNSTNSLVGILKQWNLEASDLITVVDKLNYTADSNAITTQDLVDGLLRASGAAKNAKISFDETVGALVALREATGRTGKELGTALNSIIAYTTKTSSLNVFENLGATVYLDEQKESLVSVMEIWRQLSELYRTEGEKVYSVLEKQTDLTELFSEEVAAAAGELDKYNQVLETQAKLQGDITEIERGKLTEQFGVYRRNYVIALLEDFEKIGQVVDDMDNSIGHSARENERYMQTLEAKVNQLVTSLKELAVQAGEAGLLDIAKGAVEALTAITNLTKSVGGLVPVLITLTGLVAIIKREKIASSIDGLHKNITQLVPQLKNAAKGLDDVNKAAESSSTSINAGATAFAGWVGIITTAIGIIWQITSAIEQHNAAMRQQALTASESAKSQADSIRSLVDEYERLQSLNLAPGDEEYLQLQDQITDALGGRASQLNGLTIGTEEYTEALKAATQAELEYLDAATKAGLVASKQQLESDASKGFWLVDAGNVGNVVLDALQYSNELKDVIADILGEYETLYGTYSVPKEADDILKFHYDLLEARRALSEYDRENPEAGVLDSKLWSDITAAIESTSYATEYLGYKLYELKGAFEISNGPVETIEAFEQLKESIYETLEATDKQKQDIDQILNSYYPNLAAETAAVADSFVEAASAIDQWSTTIDASEKVISNLRSEISNLESSMEALANGQGLTLDKTLDLLNTYPELASAIHVVGDEWYFEADALEILRQAKYNDLIATQAKLVYDELSASMTAEQRDRLHELTIALIEATDATTRQAAAAEYLAYVHSVAAGEAVNYASALKQIELISAAAGRQIVSSGVSYQGSADAIKRQTAATKANTDAINENIKALQKQQKEADGLYKKSIENIQKEQKAADAASKARIKALQKERDEVDKSYQKRIKALQAELKEITANYNAQEEAVKKRYNAEIESLRKLKQEESRSDARGDYERSRAELLAERAEHEKRTSREAVERIKEIDKALEDLDRNEERRLRDNSIDDQIASIEKVRDAELEAIKVAMEAQQERFAREIERMQQEQQAAKDSYAIQIEAIQAAADAQKEAFNDQINALKEKQAADKEAYEARIEALREEVEAVKKASENQIADVRAVSQATDEMTTAAIREFWELYIRATEYGDNWARQQLQNNESVYRSIQQLKQAYDSLNKDIYAGRENPTYIPGSHKPIPRSHTGSLVTSEGLVDVAPAEIIVRPDISAGLMRNIRAMDQIQNFVNNATSNNQNYSRSVNVGGVHVSGIFESKRQAQQAGRTAAEELTYRLNRLP